MNKHGWTYKKLEDVCDFSRGLTYKGKDEVGYSSNVVLRSNNVDLATYTLNLDDLKYIAEDITIPEDKFVKKNSLLICMSNGSKQHLGKVAFIDRDYPYAFGGFMGLIKPIETEVFPKYVYYYCCSPKYKSFLLTIGNGANINNLRFSDIGKNQLPVPSMEEQEAIVAELDVINEAIAALQQQVADLNKLEQSTFYTMFGDPVSNEKGWDKSSLSKMGILARGVSKHRPRNAPELLGGTMPLIQTGDVSNADFYIRNYSSTYSELGVSQSKIWKAGTLCITIAATIGKCAILSFDACFPDSVVGFSVNDKLCNNEYVFFIFKRLQTILEENAPAVAQKNINLKVLNDLELPLPPLSLQQEFAAKVEAIESAKAEINTQMAEMQTLLASRMDYYFG